jgi:TRADD-N domain-containing protein
VKRWTRETSETLLLSTKTLIIRYYEDVQHQAKQSFDSAKSVARTGFLVLIATLAYTLLIDAANRFYLHGSALTQQPLRAVIGIGTVSGALIEFIAGINFWLYARASRQFGAFHICLERTHRYLVAYKIAGEIREKKDEALEHLVCIMANAPMITHQDVDAVGSKSGIAKVLPHQAPADSQTR